MVVSLKPLGPVAQMMMDDEFEVHTCGGRRGWDFRVIGRLAKIISSSTPDVVHALLFHANVAARQAARRINFPPDRVVCEIQTVEVERRWHLLVDRWTHRGCRFTIGNSPSVVDHLATHARISRDRLRLVRGGIDPGPLREAKPIDKTALGQPDDAPIVLWVGRLDVVKGLELLVESFQPIAANTSSHLLLAGTGPLHARLTHLIGALDLSDRIHLLGPRDDVPALLKSANVFVFPSRTEGLPNALLEAMAAQCAVVTTDVPGCRDLIQHEENGLLVPYGDVEALSCAIRRLLDDRALASSLARRAAEVVEQDWHIEKTYAAYRAVYAEIP